MIAPILRRLDGGVDLAVEFFDGPVAEHAAETFEDRHRRLR